MPWKGLVGCGQTRRCRDRDLISSPRRSESQLWVGQEALGEMVRSSRVWWRAVRAWLRRLWRWVSMCSAGG
jgi:hypothetical protein